MRHSGSQEIRSDAACAEKHRSKRRSKRAIDRRHVHLQRPNAECMFVRLLRRRHPRRLLRRPHQGGQFRYQIIHQDSNGRQHAPPRREQNTHHALAGVVGGKHPHQAARRQRIETRDGVARPARTLAVFTIPGRRPASQLGVGDRRPGSGDSYRALAPACRQSLPDGAGDAIGPILRLSGGASGARK